ncbi:MAG: ribosome maturation factor RimM, partial [Paludibacter sp.]|nr:ribosome maturation factor RimM [Paludibacter sp.]
FFIFEIDGILVPFSVDDYRYKTNTTGILSIEGINSEQEAKQFSGLTIYLQKQYLEAVEDAEIELDYFVGFRLIDVEKGEIGIINEVDQTTENALFVIIKDEDELLVPVGDEYIQEIDHQQKTITVSLPEGLLDL